MSETSSRLFVSFMMKKRGLDCSSPFAGKGMQLATLEQDMWVSEKVLHAVSGRPQVGCRVSSLCPCVVLL
jgi:hypothetical protein